MYVVLILKFKYKKVKPKPVMSYWIDSIYCSKQERLLELRASHTVSTGEIITRAPYIEPWPDTRAEKNWFLSSTISQFYKVLGWQFISTFRFLFRQTIGTTINSFKLLFSIKVRNYE